MDLFTKNPFLVGLAGTGALIVLVGGYLVFSQASRLAEEETSFSEKKTSLARLQSNKPFPSQTNVASMQEETRQAAGLLEEIAKNFQVSTPTLSPQAFQDELNKMVKDIREKAVQKSVLLPADFYLGFEKYETQPPSTEATPQLGLQLRAIHAVASVLVDSQVTSLGAIVRAPLQGEVVLEEAEPEEKPRRKQKEEPEVHFAMAPFDVNFTADQSAFRLAFNRILGISPPLFVRLVAIANSSPTPPSKTDPAAETEPQTAETEPAGIKAVLGREKLVVDLRLASIAPGIVSP